MSDAQAAGFQADGFEVALHVQTSCQDFTPASLEAARRATSWPTSRPPGRAWRDPAHEPHPLPGLERLGQRAAARARARHPPRHHLLLPRAARLADQRPGLLTGSGLPAALRRPGRVDHRRLPGDDPGHRRVRPADRGAGGRAAGQRARRRRATTACCTVNMHSDDGDQVNANDIVASAQERGVPVVSAAQMLDWLDGRNGSSFANVTTSAGQLSFSLVARPEGARARGDGPGEPRPAGPLSRLTRNGQPVSRTRAPSRASTTWSSTALAGDYVATYAPDTRAPEITSASRPWPTGRATPRSRGPPTSPPPRAWTTAAPRRSGARCPTAARVTAHSVELTGLSPGTTYFFRVRSVDAVGNSAQLPASSGAPSSFQTPSAAASWTAGPPSSPPAPTAAHTRRRHAWRGRTARCSSSRRWARSSRARCPPLGRWRPGSRRDAESTGGARSPSTVRARARPPSTTGPRTLEFTAAFEPVNDQAVGFGRDLDDFPGAAFTTGGGGRADPPLRVERGELEQRRRSRRSRVRLARPASLPHRVVGLDACASTWTARSWPPIRSRSRAALRPVVSDFRAFGAGVRTEWLRQGTYATSRHVHLAGARRRPRHGDWQTLAAQSSVPSGTTLAFDTRSGSTPQPDGAWSGWQALGGGGAVASPTARYIQYRATHDELAGASTPTLRRAELRFAGS